jgi:hypothetical protein
VHAYAWSGLGRGNTAAQLACLHVRETQKTWQGAVLRNAKDVGDGFEEVRGLETTWSGLTQLSFGYGSWVLQSSLRDSVEVQTF